MIPDEFVGVWQRQSLALGGSPGTEPAYVFWLQGRSAYADLRIPVDGSTKGLGAFAGHTTWEPPHLRWSHQLDLTGSPAAAVDVGRVQWDGTDLIETGTFVIDGRDVAYVEVWRKQPAASSRAVEITDACLVHVGVGEHALTVVDEREAGGSMSARYRRNGAVILALPEMTSACAGPMPVSAVSTGSRR